MDSKIKSLMVGRVFVFVGCLMLAADLAYVYLMGRTWQQVVESPNIMILLAGSCLAVACPLGGFFSRRYGGLDLQETVDRFLDRHYVWILCLLVLAGFGLRFIDLGYLSFWVDEINTSYPAMMLLEKGVPAKPSGEVEIRSPLNILFTALSFRIFGVSEFSGRLVSVFFSILTIPLVYLMGARICNKRVGVAAAFITAFYIQNIIWARAARMYAQLQFFYLLTAYLFYRGLERGDKRLMAFSLASFFCSILTERLGLVFLPVAAAYMILYRGEYLRRSRWILGGVLVLGAVLLYISLKYSSPITMVRVTPFWGDMPTYFYLLNYGLNPLVWIALAYCALSAVLYALRLLKDRGVEPYMPLNFFIPVFLLTLFPWKNIKFLNFAEPFLFLTAASVADLYVVRNAFKGLAGAFGLEAGAADCFRYAVAGFVIGLLLAWGVQDSYALYKNLYFRKSHGRVFYYGGYERIDYRNWRGACGYVREHMSEGDVIASTVPHEVVYYLGRVDYYLCQEMCEPFTDYVNKTFLHEKTRAVALRSYDQFVYGVSGTNGWVIADRGRFNSKQIDRQVRDYIQKNMTYHPEGSDDTMVVYSWGKTG